MYGHFTTVRVEEDGVRGWARHEARLARDSQTMFDVGVDLDAVRAVLLETVATRSKPVVARVAVTADDFDRNHPGGSRLRIEVTCRDAPPVASDGLAPVRLQPVAHTRSLTTIKHLASAPELYQRRLAQGAGYDDAVFVDGRGVISEGPTSGIAFMRGHTLVLTDAAQLPSTTLDLLAEVAVEVVHEPVWLDALPDYDACLLVSAVMGIRRVAAIGDTTFGLDQPSVTALSDAYLALPRSPL